MATDTQGDQPAGEASHPSRTAALALTPPPKRRKTRGRSARRVLLGVGLAVALLAVTGFLYQTIATAVDAANYPPPGRLIDVGGYRLHLNCTGTGRPDSPTVILDAGLGDASPIWSKVQPEVAAFARVCSYDRAGYGWSDTGAAPRTAARMVGELRTLLARAAVPGPYVLVGHSFGGLLVRLYAFTDLQEVAGLVLVDSSHEDQNTRIPAARQNDVNEMQQIALCQPIAPFGIVRLLGLTNGNVNEFAAAVQPAAKAQLNQTRFCQSVAADLAGLDESYFQVRAARHPLGRLPLVVLTHGTPLPDPQAEQEWTALQTDLAALSANSRRTVATGSGHDIHLERPDLVVAAIKGVLSGNVQPTP